MPRILIIIFCVRSLIDSDCSPHIQDVLCHILQPACYEDASSHLEISQIVPPCRSVCKSTADALVENLLLPLICVWNW